MRECEKILNQLRATKNGWGEDDLRKLYVGFGFEEYGNKHAVFVHPDYPQLRATVGRHRSLATGYAAYAVKLIEQLKSFQEEDGNEN